MFGSSTVQLFAKNIDAQALRERYSSNPFVNTEKTNGAGAVGTTPAESYGVTSPIDFNVNIKPPKADKNSAYAGFYAPMYGEANYNGKKLDFFS